jgi:hypothetical protein
VAPGIVWTALRVAFVLLGILPGEGALAEPVAAVTVSGNAVLTICRNWILFHTCKSYDKIDLPERVSVGDRLTLTSFGSNPKDYVFYVVEIRPKGDGCLLLSGVSKGREDRERIEVPHCEPAPKPAARSQ